MIEVPLSFPKNALNLFFGQDDIHDRQPTSQICLDHQSDSKKAFTEEYKTKLAYGSIKFYQTQKRA